MNKKYLFLGSILILITSIAYIFLNNNIFFANANPDYICKKSVSGQACQITSCGEWKTDGTRVCNGTRTTEVSYYNIRTTCESGYTQVGLGNNVGGSSGRHGADYVSSSTLCTITEVDNTAPVGNISGS